MIRTDAKLSVSRFAELIDVSRRTYTYRLAKHRAGDPAKGPWPAPVVDRIEPVVAKYAAEFPAWGHRKIRAIADIDGHDTDLVEIETRLPGHELDGGGQRLGVAPIARSVERRQHPFMAADGDADNDPGK